jgi:hypothetical protein
VANLPVGKVSKLFVALKERPTLKVSDKRGWAQSLVREQTHEGNTRADAPRRRVTAESYGFKAWEVRQLVILLDESRSPYHPMRMSKVRSLRSREWSGDGAVLDFVGRAAFSTQGAKVMSSRPNIEGLHVEKKSVGGCL